MAFIQPIFLPLKKTAEKKQRPFITQNMEKIITEEKQFEQMNFSTTGLPLEIMKIVVLLIAIFQMETYLPSILRIAPSIAAT